ncbi:unnamed protein product [Closterium sp. NIES-53]
MDAEADTEAEAGAKAGTEAGTEADVFPEGGVGGEDDDSVEYWSRDGLPEKLSIPTYPPRNQKRPHPSSDNSDARPLSPRHKPPQHKRQAYTAQEKLKWLERLKVGVSELALPRESGIHSKCLTEWKRASQVLKDAHGAQKRMHGRGRASWYRPMELKVYTRLLEWRRRGVAVSVGRLQECLREFMKALFLDVKWKGSQWWTDRFRKRWNLSVRMKTRVAQKTFEHKCRQAAQAVLAVVRDACREYRIEIRYIINANQTSLWLEMPATTTVDEMGMRSVPNNNGSYQKERVTVMLTCTADREKLKPWVFFKRKTFPKDLQPIVSCTDLVMACHQNGWMDAAGITRWLDECIKPLILPRFGRQARSEMLVLDSYCGHLMEEMKAKFAELMIVPAIIPGGCTAEAQPLDMPINKSLKASVRQHNALDESKERLVMVHRRSQLTHEVDVDDDIIADGFSGNNCPEPEFDDDDHLP